VSFRFALAPWFEEHADQVRADLAAYYSDKAVFPGRYFDVHASRTDPDHFEAGDVLAVQSLSALHDPHPAGTLLVDEPARFDALLAQVPKGRALWEVDRPEVGPGSAAVALWEALQEIRLVSRVGAGKLLAAKRPLLIPVHDDKVSAFVEAGFDGFWLGLWDELSHESDRQAIEQVVTTAPAHVGLLRRIDVALWMQARRGATVLTDR
jgi:hypothetical protein